eukprot:scaffold1136_cov399-Prasinococcus_capsulatus_cf.AAC.7
MATAATATTTDLHPRAPRMEVYTYRSVSWRASQWPVPRRHHPCTWLLRHGRGPTWPNPSSRGCLNAARDPAAGIEEKLSESPEAAMFFGGGFQSRGTFEQRYRIYPVSFIDKPQLENGDKIILPPSALDRLASLHIDYPMLFNVSTLNSSARQTHCGTSGASPSLAHRSGAYQQPGADYSTTHCRCIGVRGRRGCCIPSVLDDGKPVLAGRRGSQDKERVPAQGIVRKTAASLQGGDTILVNYNNKKFYIDVKETKPGEAISIIETDCEVDFMAPLDYVEPTPQPVQRQSSGKAVAATKAAEPEPEPEPPQTLFRAFSGTGVRLDGKPVKSSPLKSPPVTSMETDAVPRPAKAQAASSSSEPVQAAAGPTADNPLAAFKNKRRQRSAKFKAEKEAKEKEEEEKKGEPKFAAFSGKSYSLRG